MNFICLTVGPRRSATFSLLGALALFATTAHAQAPAPSQAAPAPAALPAPSAQPVPSSQLQEPLVADPRAPVATQPQTSLAQPQAPVGQVPALPQGEQPATAVPVAPPANGVALPTVDATPGAPVGQTPMLAVGPIGKTSTTIAQGEVEVRRQTPEDNPEKPDEPKKDVPWYEKIKIRGYTQFRYNRIPGANRNDELRNSQGDRFLGKDNGFGIRRARLIIYGDVHERVSIYLQPDFASVIGDQLNVAILRDWYADIFLTKDKSLRVRVGQSKVPYGFENLQSSQNRLALDRNDALNSAVKDERDLGMFVYWAPKEIRDRFKHLVDSGLKGSGDYGVLGVGVYNGQTANRPAAGDNMHGIGRVTWPFKFGEQFVELGGGGYFGRYRTTVETAKGFTAAEKDIKDARLFGTVVVYPQPFGFQAEGTYGSGPSLGEKETRRIEERRLFGGYAQLMYKIDHLLGTESLIPYARATYYEGGKKFDSNAPKHIVKELEIGVEWQLIKALEVVLAYDMAHRQVFQEKPYDQKGHVGRVQLQFNY